MGKTLPPGGALFFSVCGRGGTAHRAVGHEGPRRSVLQRVGERHEPVRMVSSLRSPPTVTANPPRKVRPATPLPVRGSVVSGRATCSPSTWVSGALVVVVSPRTAAVVGVVAPVVVVTVVVVDVVVVVVGAAQAWTQNTLCLVSAP